MTLPGKNIREKFDLWVKNLTPGQARIAVFNQIRDIPYYLVPQVPDPCQWADSILKENKGSCSPKHYLLGLLFTELGISIKYATYAFKWGKQEIKYPAELMELAERSPVGYHVACQACLNGEWVLVDATWDSALKHVGFPVNENWDGVSATLNAVMPFKEIIHQSLQDRLNYVAEKRKLYSEAEKITYADFSAKFNLWLESIRQ